MSRARLALLPLFTSALACSQQERPAAGFEPLAATEGLVSDGGSDAGSTGHVSIIDDRPLYIADPPPPPITGGGILVLGDGTTALVSDTERDMVHVVDIADRIELRVIELPPGSQPWRLARDNVGGVHVALRGTGSVATVDAELGEVVAERSVCKNLRGIAAAPAIGELLAVCASGELWRLPEGGEAELVQRLLPDLRDVVVDADGTVRVTRFRSAEVLTLAADGSIESHYRPDEWWIETDGDALGAMRSNTAWQTVGMPDGGWLMVHQGSSAAPIDLDDDDGDPYGGEEPVPCASIVQTTATLGLPDGTIRSIGAVPDTAVPVGIAVDPTGQHMAIAVAGSCTVECALRDIVLVDLSDFGADSVRPCREPMPYEIGPDAEFVAVAFAPDGRLLVQQRDPIRLFVFEDDGDGVGILLQGDALDDTAHRLFHEAGRAGVACASCHPEGGDDGLVWMFDAPRHTPALYVGLAGTEPFHWEGGLPDFASLVAEVHERRMGEMVESEERVAAFEAWVTALRQPAPRAADDPAAEPGRALFSAYHCDSCHVGEATTNSQTVSIGGAEAVQVPSLHAVALHPPYFSDGSAESLELAVRSMIERTQPELAATEEEIDQLLAYLETL